MIKRYRCATDSITEFVGENNINAHTLGVHLRLTDMNTVHPEYGHVTIEKYISATRTYLESHSDIKNIFVSSDNDESIRIFESNFPDYKVVSYTDGIRCTSSRDDNYQFQLRNLSDPTFLQKITIEALILSKCGALIHRISDYANFAILFSNTYTDIICI